LAKEVGPEVVVCDIGLPDLDGFQVARALRALRSPKPMRLVALSGYAMPRDRAQALEAGFDAHLPKPTSLNALLAALRGAPTEVS
jgi:two-component system CheB/CheR fusion protein